MAAARNPITMAISSSVLLRSVQESDLPIFFEQQLDQEARKMAAFPGREHDAFMTHWHKILADKGCITYTIVFDGRVAGNIGCWEAEGKWQIGYWLGREFWGQGIASAALAQFLETVTTRPLFAHVAKTNVASIRVLQKCGFTMCGEDRFTMPDGIMGEELILRLQPDQHAAISTATT